MSYASNFALDIYAYVDTKTGKAVSLFCSTPIGLTYRVNGDWEVPESQAAVDEMTKGYDCYSLNWEKNPEGVSEDTPDDADHEAITEFDNGTLDTSNIETFFDFAYKAGEFELD